VSAFIALAACGVVMLAVVSIPFWAIYALSSWWHTEGPGKIVPEPAPPCDETFTCWECGSGPWGREWDPHCQSMTSPKRRARGLGLCPNCSGAT
jgi:hypothetical protein